MSSYPPPRFGPDLADHDDCTPILPPNGSRLPAHDSERAETEQRRKETKQYCYIGSQRQRCTGLEDTKKEKKNNRNSPIPHEAGGARLRNCRCSRAWSSEPTDPLPKPCQDKCWQSRVLHRKCKTVIRGSFSWLACSTTPRISAAA